MNPKPIAVAFHLGTLCFSGCRSIQLGRERKIDKNKHGPWWLMHRNDMLAILERVEANVLL